MDDSLQVSGVDQVRLQFTGRGGEYFRIWIVNLALTIVTLGIYSAWAKVRRLRYIYGHTQLAGHRFSYLADPVRILIGRIIALLLLGAYSLCWNLFPTLAFGTLTVGILLIPAVIVTSMSFTLRNTAYRNVRFRFHRNYREAYRIYLIPALIVLTIAGLFYLLIDPELLRQPQQEQQITRRDLLPLGVWLGVLPLIPWLDFLRCRFLIDHTRFGDLRARFDATVGQFFWLYLKTLGAFIGIAIGVGIGMAAVGGVATVGRPDSVDPATNPAFASGILAGFGTMFLSMLLLSAWFAARRGNLLRNHTRFGDNEVRGTLRARGLLWLNVSNLVLLILTLGLYAPFAQIRMARFFIEHTAVDVNGLETVVAIAEADRSALGEELGEAFDIDLGL